MENEIDATEKFYILAGTASEYTVARQKLDLIPKQAFWVSTPSRLKDLSKPKVYRYGSWRNLLKVGEIEAALEDIEAVVEDIE